MIVWNPVKRRYYENGHALTPAQVKAHVEGFINHEQTIVKEQSDRLFARSISVAAFFLFMRQRVAIWHGVAATIAYGGPNQMTRERWRRVNEKIQSEINYLNDFEQQAVASFAVAEILASKAVKSIADQIPPGLEPVVQNAVADALVQAAPSEAEQVARTAVEKSLADSVDDPSVIAKGLTLAGVASAALLIGGTIPARSSMYTESIWATHEQQSLERERDSGITLGRRIVEADGNSCDDCLLAATEEFIPLEDIPEIGSLQCVSNCRCEIEFSVDGAEFATSDVFQGVIRGQTGDVSVN